MFDIGFQELLVLAVLGLLVLGPERLPRVARTVGGYARKARQAWYSVRNEIESELAAEDVRRSLEESSQALKSLEEDINADQTQPDKKSDND